MKKIVQLIPVSNFTAVYEEDDGSEFTLPIIAIGLTDIGNAELLSVTSNGDVFIANESGNFVEIRLNNIKL
jgi:hypothetical protein|nr:MAG TPA: hypothetical protein [Caudoviricetes sp.]